MRSTGKGYPAALRTTLRQAAAAYGYTLTIATTSALLSSVRGVPAAGALFLFAVGGLLGFLVLDLVLQFSGASGSEDPRTAFPFAGTLNFLSVLTALGAADLVAHLDRSASAWLLAPFIATAAYMAIVALQVATVGAARHGSSDAGAGPAEGP